MMRTVRGLLALFLGTLFLSFAGCGGGGGDAAAPPAAPVIAAQPADTQLTQGGNAQFQVSASVQGAALSYQWQRSNDAGTTWVAIAGATSATLTLASVGTTDSGARFRVVVTGAGPSTISSAATLTVVAAVSPPAITVQPVAQQVTEGASASFSITATGTALTYQWQRSSDGQAWSDIAGATQATLQLTALALADNGQRLRVVLRNSAATLNSDAVLLTVQAAPAAPVVTTQPASTAVTAPAAATFTAVVTGNPAPTLQWQRSTDAGATYADIAGATQASYTTAATALGDNGSLLRLRAVNTAGTVTSTAATLTVNAALVAPTIQQQPQDVNTTPGQTATWTVAGTGNPQPAYQWQLSTDGGVSFANINGATAASYSAVVTLADSGRRLRVVVSNSQGSVDSRAAVLTVTAPPSVLTSRAWTAGQQMEAGDGIMPGLVASRIDDQGRVISVFAKHDGARVALYAVRGTPGAAGQAPSYSTPVVIDAAQPFDWRNGVSLAVSPGGNAVAGWQVQAPCTASTYATSGNCTYWVVARYMAATNSWDAPAVVGDMANLPFFEANINDAGDIAGMGSGWNRNASGDLDPVAFAAYWRANGQSAFSRRVFAIDLSDASIPSLLVLDGAGNFVVMGRGRQGLVTSYDAIAYRGSVRTGVGAREVIDLRGADVTNPLGYGNAAGQVVLTWHQNNGTQATTYAATLDSPTGAWSVTDLGVAPQTSDTAATLSAEGDFMRYSWTRCSVVRRTAGTWVAEALLPAGTCGGGAKFALARNGHFLAVQTVGGVGKWLSYDATLRSVVSAYTAGANGTGYVLGVPVLPTNELLLAPNGIGALVSANTYDVLPTVAAPAGDSRGVTSLWGLTFK